MVGDGSSRVGQSFGPYRLLALIGRGGMGEVYRAYDTVKDREVALKLLPPDLAGDREYRERFQREARVAARLNEPHVIPIHDFGEIDGVLYIDMRLVHGKDLRGVLRRPGLMQPEVAVDLVRQIGEALDAAHADGLVHRDVKPENIMVLPSGFAYLADFGIASRSDDVRLTHAGNAIGSFAYMAPERFSDAPVGPAADLYALGCVLYECLCGTAPFQRSSAASVINAHLNQAPDRITERRADLTAAMDAVLARAMAKEPGLRFRTAREFSAAAAAALHGRGPTGFTAAEPTRGAGVSIAPRERQRSDMVTGLAGLSQLPVRADDAPARTSGSAAPTPTRQGGGGGIAWWAIVASVVLFAVAAVLAVKLLSGNNNGSSNVGATQSSTASASGATSGGGQGTTASSPAVQSAADATSSTSSSPSWATTLAAGSGYNAQGWAGYARATCSGDDRAVMVASTNVSLMTICQTHLGNLYYLGLRPAQSTQPNYIRLENPTRSADGVWQVRNIPLAVTYTISRSQLTIDDANTGAHETGDITNFVEIPLD